MFELIRCNFCSTRWFLAGWILPLTALIAVVPRAYHDTYPNAEELKRLADPMRGQLGLRVLYGVVPDPLTIPSFTTWETGMWVILLGCVMSLLLAIRLSRAAEEDGILEVVRVTGMGRATANLAAAATVLLACCILGVASTLALYAQNLHLEGFDFYSCLLLGKTVTLATGCFGGVGMLCAQWSRTAREARSAAVIALAGAFFLRVVADVWDFPHLRWCSPLAWRDLVKPFEQDHAWPLVAALGITLVCYAPLLVPRDLHATWTARIPYPFRMRNQRNVINHWFVAITIITVALFALTGEMNALLERSPNTAALMQSITGDAETEASYLRFIATPVGILIACATVQISLATARDERSGVITQEVVNGNTRHRPLLTDFGTAVAVTLGMVAIIAPLCAIVADASTNADVFEAAWQSILDQAPPAIAATGFATLVTGCSLRWSVLAWIPVTASGFITFFGALLDFPTWLQDASLFAWPAHEHTFAAVMLVCIGFGCALVGAIAYRHRDLHC